MTTVLLHNINKNFSAVHGQKSRLKLKYYQLLSQEDKTNGKCNVVNINNHMDVSGTFSKHGEYITGLVAKCSGETKESLEDIHDTSEVQKLFHKNVMDDMLIVIVSKKWDNI